MVSLLTSLPLYAHRPEGCLIKLSMVPSLRWTFMVGFFTCPWWQYRHFEPRTATGYLRWNSHCTTQVQGLESPLSWWNPGDHRLWWHAARAGCNGHCAIVFVAKHRNCGLRIQEYPCWVNGLCIGLRHYNGFFWPISSWLEKSKNQVHGSFEESLSFCLWRWKSLSEMTLWHFALNLIHWKTVIYVNKMSLMNVTITACQWHFDVIASFYN